MLLIGRRIVLRRLNLKILNDADFVSSQGQFFVPLFRSIREKLFIYVFILYGMGEMVFSLRVPER